MRQQVLGGHLKSARTRRIVPWARCTSTSVLHHIANNNNNNGTLKKQTLWSHPSSQCRIPNQVTTITSNHKSLGCHQFKWHSSLSAMAFQYHGRKDNKCRLAADFATMTLPADEKGMGFSKWRAESQDTTNNNYDSVNHSGTSSAAKALEETTGFGAFWCRCNDRLLAISAASEFQPQDWMYAEQLLQALASHHESTTPENAEQEMPSQSSFSSHVSIVTGAFELLDRLCDEVPQQLARQQREGKGEESPKSDQLSFSSLPSQSLHLPLSSRSLTSVLTIWQQCRRTCASEPPPSNVDAAPVAPLLEPMIVFDKINNYIQTGLFVANLDPYHVLLESVAAAGPVQERHKSLFQIVRYLLEQSKQDPEHPLYPTITTVELAMQGTEKGASPLDQHGILPRQQQLEMIQRTDVYMKLLQHGQQQTGREDFRVTPFIGVTALRALSRINPSIMDLNESGRRIGELVVRLIDQYCCSSTNAGTSENVDSIVCQLAQSARPKDGLPATAAWAILKEWLQRKSQNSSFARVGEDDISESTTTTAIGKPQQSTLLAVVSALTRSGHMEEAAQVVQHMTEHAWQNLSEIRTRRKQLLTLLWAYATVRDFQGAKTLLQDWNNIDTNELNTFLLDEIDSRTWDEVLSLCEEFGFRDALSQPVAFIIRLHRALLTGRGNVKSTERFLLNKFLTHCSQKSHANRAVDIAMELVQWMEQQTSHKINPDGSSYFNALLALKNSERIDRCTGYLRKLCDGVRSGKIKPKELDQRMFSMVITAQPKSAWTRARVVFDWMLEVGIHPGTLCYNSLISAIVHSDDDLHPEEKANLAVEIFAQMQPFGEGELSVKPDQSTFDLVLLGLSKSSNPEHLVNAQALLDEMKRRWIKPSRASYRALMLAWAKLGNPDKAEQVFQSLKNSYILGEINEKPGYKEYAARLEFWSNAGIPEMTKAALQEMLKEYDAGSLETKPGLKDYSAVIEAWVRSDSPQALDKAESELREIDRLANDDPKVAEARPNVFCYTALIAGYAQANLIEKALLLLNELHEISASMNDDFGVKPSVTTYNAILSALPNARGKTNCENAEALWEQMRDYGIQLNVDTYHALFATFARRPGILVGNIEELFHDMKQQYENGKKMLKPPFEVYSIRLIAWFKARNPEMTEQVLNEMVSLSESKYFDQAPGTSEFNVALNSWMLSGNLNSASRAEMLFRRMTQYASDSNKRFDCHPDVSSYNFLIGTYARSDVPQAGERALELFTELVTLSQQEQQQQEQQQVVEEQIVDKNITKPISNDGKHRLLQPNSVTFLETLTAVSRSNFEHREAAIRLLMHELARQEVEFWRGTQSRTLLFMLGQILDASHALEPSTREELKAEYRQLKNTVLTLKDGLKQKLSVNNELDLSQPKTGF